MPNAGSAAPITEDADDLAAGIGNLPGSAELRKARPAEIAEVNEDLAVRRR